MFSILSNKKSSWPINHVITVKLSAFNVIILHANKPAKLSKFLPYCITKWFWNF